MNICPSCREEFLDHVLVCNACDEKLISEILYRAYDRNNAMKSKEELLQGKTLTLSEGSLAHCRELEKILVKAQISCAVYPASLSCSDHKTNSASCATPYLVLVSEDELDPCRQALADHFAAQVAREGQGSLVNDVIDIGQEYIVCPACHQQGALNKGECSSCGLFLGEHT